MADGVADHGSGGLGLDQAERKTFLLLALGHLLFVVGMFGAIATEARMWDYWILTPLFGLPLAIAGGRTRRWTRAAVLLVGLTAIHYLATFAAVNTVTLTPTLFPRITSSMLVTGATGGAVGAAGSLALCALSGLIARTRRNLAVAAVGVAALTLIGAIALEVLMAPSEEMRPWMALLLYTPWQIAFAYALAKLLR